MDNSRLCNEFKGYLDSLKPSFKTQEWIYIGKTDDAFGSPGGSWKGQDGFRFKEERSKQEYLLRSILDNAYIVLESYSTRRQVYNMDLSKNSIHQNKNKKSILLESFIMTAGKGRVKKQDVKKAFKELGVESNQVAEVSDENPNWANFVSSLLTWANHREEVKKLLKSTPKVTPEQDVREEKQTKKQEMNSTPLNQIFFGPPGTGKTYFLLENVIPDFKQKSIPKSPEIIESEIISELPWWKIFALVLLDDGNQTVPQIKEHRFVKYKLAVSNTKSLNQTVWGQLSSHTIKESKTVEYGSRIGSLIFDKKEDSIWFIAKHNDPAINELQELMNELKVAENSSNKEINNFKFITFHQSTAYETFVEGIMPVLSEETKDETTEVQYEVRKGTFYKACDQAAKLAGFLGLKDCIEHSKEERIEKFKTAKPYALLIDEINRGNISSILGELITLIEEDKRLTKNEIIVELPYSGNPFAVPPNLHIIGTMNTADRSVEALDTALRRRFSFTEMPPRYDLVELEYEFAGAKGSEILKKINKRIEKLLDRDHLIGHSYFLLSQEEKQQPETKLMDSFYRNIIPLLQEYFFGDYAKIGAVLGSGFVYTENENDQADFATGYENEDFAEKDIYQIIDYRPNQTGNKYMQPDMTFEKAIRLLMNQTLKTEVES